MNFVNLNRLKSRMTGLAQTGLLLSLMVLSPLTWAANKLIDVQYQSAVGNQLQIDLIFDKPVSEPQIELSADPAILALNFSDALSSLELNDIKVDSKGVQSLQAEQDLQTLRFMVNLEKVAPYSTNIIGNTYRVVINQDSRGQVANTGQNTVERIDFRRGPSGEGELVVELASDVIAANLQQVGSNLELQLYNTQLKDDDLYVVDVQDFATVVRGYETFKDDLNSRIQISVSGNYEFNQRQQGRLLRIRVAKVDEVSAAAKEKPNYEGRELSLNFQNISVRTVLQIIADYNNFNLVTSDTVDGNITLRLDDVPWDQALDLILQVKGLDKRIEGNILMVAPKEEMNIRENLNLEAAQKAEELAPLYSEYMQINYAKASDIAALLKTDDSSLLSTRGTVAVDERTNTLLVQDTSDKLEDVHRLIDVLDVPVKQVVIESRMVTVRDDFAEDLGIRWGITNKTGDLGTSGSLEGAESAAGGTVPSLDDRLNVNLPAAPAGGTPASIAFHVAKLANGTVLDLELSALEQESKGEVVASPRITTANQKSAYIEQGVEIPYVESASSGATSVTFKKAVLGLTVTPHITPDNRIILDLEISQDSQGRSVDTPTGPAVSIDTQRIGTQVLAENGETIVLGGIYQQSNLNRISKVPILGDIPYLGTLFRTTSDSSERREVLVFVTPRIVESGIKQ
ncbi:secretin [Paraferrimonas haliotis]|uniref:Secretin n=2 Tax=Paraferrimonas haliotis TaxID=2013866 RepID=A0AA37WVA9_9GAMM|nr:type IV pilus secretin PilQ family protein [Paraferrimonas haliotis]GLS82173.1 secretin [Paraferrimonas haliotis]